MRTLAISATIALLAAGAAAQEQERAQDPAPEQERPQDPAPAQAPAPDEGPALEKKPVTRARERALARYDANRDGVLDADEKERMRVDRKARVDAIKARIYASYDANRNGKLEPDEERAFVQDRDRNKVFKGAALRKHDANGDGQLDTQERQQMLESRNAYLERLRRQTMAIYDTNRNGVLDPAERAVMNARARGTRTQ